MSQLVAIEVSNVSKTFKKQTEPAKTFKERVITWSSSKSNVFSALDNVDFDVKVGESVGVLGHNGSGKSTLLKTIAGTLRPSSGVVKVRGRLSALLELGAGFHPDLTGEENVYLNGSLLGFSKEQIDEIFDEIVDFAEIGDFIYTQVKHYSSGMYARLGFAVAINLQPDVLLVDEVLAVGDEAFQRKCIARINRFQEKGRTLMLVTHSPEQVNDICDRVIVLNHGKMIHAGDVREGINVYRKSIHGDDYSDLNLLDANQNLSSLHSLKVSNCTVSSSAGLGNLVSGEDAEILVDIDSSDSLEAVLRLIFHNHEPLDVVNISNLSLNGELFKLKKGHNRLRLNILNCPLATGVYTVSLVASDRSEESIYASIEKINKFSVQGSYDSGRIFLEASMSLEK